jgi:hypothetical protein
MSNSREDALEIEPFEPIIYFEVYIIICNLKKPEELNIMSLVTS